MGSKDMPSTACDTRQISIAPDAVAPDGSEVRVLCATAGGSMAAFALAPGAVARAVVHRTVDEIWYVCAGEGRIWRRSDAAAEVIDLVPGLSLTIPVGTAFQFRCDGAVPLRILAVTLPPWPGDGEAQPVFGKWIATL